MTKWNKAQTLELINLYKQYPILYDTKSEEYLDQVKKNFVLSKITNSLKVLRPRVTSSEVRSKINKLRNQYVREKYAMTNFQENRADGEETYAPKMRYFNELKFLDSCTLSNTGEFNDETYTESSDSSNILRHDNKLERDVSVIKKRKATLDRQISRTLSLVEEMGANMRLRNTMQQPSPQSMLGKMVENELQGIPEELFIDAKWKIMDIIQETQKRYFRLKSSTNAPEVPQLSYDCYEDSSS